MVMIYRRRIFTQDINRIVIKEFIEQANNHHPTTKFAAEVSEMETIFLDTNITEGERLKNSVHFSVTADFKPTETFQYIQFTSSTHRELKGFRQSGSSETSKSKFTV